MSSIESWVPTNTPEAGRYLPVDPQTLGRLRILRVGDVGPDRSDVRNYLEVHIRRLRTKIEIDADTPTLIRTVRGVGYIFDLPQND